VIGIIELDHRFRQGQYLTNSPGNPSNCFCGNYSFPSTCGHVVTFARRCKRTLSVVTLSPIFCPRRTPSITVSSVVVDQPCVECIKEQKMQSANEPVSLAISQPSGQLQPGNIKLTIQIQLIP
jgi:hypothetical protein